MERGLAQISGYRVLRRIRQQRLIEGFDAVSKGSIEAAWSTAGYDVGKYPALEKGVIDATEFSMPAMDIKYGFHQIAK